MAVLSQEMVTKITTLHHPKMETVYTFVVQIDLEYVVHYRNLQNTIIIINHNFPPLHEKHGHSIRTHRLI